MRRDLCPAQRVASAHSGPGSLSRTRLVSWQLAPRVEDVSPNRSMPCTVAKEQPVQRTAATGEQTRAGGFAMQEALQRNPRTGTCLRATCVHLHAWCTQCTAGVLVGRHRYRPIRKLHVTTSTTIVQLLISCAYYRFLGSTGSITSSNRNSYCGIPRAAIPRTLHTLGRECDTRCHATSDRLWRLPLT